MRISVNVVGQFKIKISQHQNKKNKNKQTSYMLNILNIVLLCIKYELYFDIIFYYYYNAKIKFFSSIENPRTWAHYYLQITKYSKRI